MIDKFWLRDGMMCRGLHRGVGGGRPHSVIQHACMLVSMHPMLQAGKLFSAMFLSELVFPCMIAVIVLHVEVRIKYVAV
jgi:hypothetical protein